MDSRPKIGLNMGRCAAEEGVALERYQISADYVQAVAEAGGMPILVPPLNCIELLRSQCQRLDGMVLIGGADYPPDLYGAEPHPETRTVCTERARADMALARHLFSESRIPVLGICLGHQLIQLAHGGALIQHLPKAERHKKVRTGLDREHRVHVRPGTRLHSIFGTDSLLVNSAHHQGIDADTIPQELEIAARDEDGMVEAVQGRDPARFVLGVQWHPERIRDEPHRRRLFSAFVDECRSQH